MHVQTIARSAIFQQLYTLVATFHAEYALTRDERTELFGLAALELETTPIAPETPIAPSIAPSIAPETPIAPTIAPAKPGKPAKAPKIARAAKPAQVTPIASTPAVDAFSELPEKARRAHYTKTAPYADLQFFLSVGQMSEGIRADALELATHVDAAGKLNGTTRALFYLSLSRLRTRKMLEADRRDWAPGAHSPFDCLAGLLASKAAAWETARCEDYRRILNAMHRKAA